MKIVLYVLIAIITLIALQWLFNGGIETYSHVIKTEGFFKFLGWFFTSIWEGFKATLGF